MNGITLINGQLNQLSIKLIVFNGLNYYEQTSSIKIILYLSNEVKYLTTKVGNDKKYREISKSKACTQKILTCIKPSIKSTF